MDIQLSDAQSSIFQDATRFKVVCAGRRFGKSFLSGAEILNAAIGIDRISGERNKKQTVVYVAPTYAMGKQIMFKWLKEYSPKGYIRKINESELLIEFRNDSIIYIKSSENYDSMRGLSLSFVVLDEVADIESEAWQLVLRPALSDQKGRAMFIGTPKGTNWFYDMYLLGKSGERDAWKSWTYTTLQGGNVDESEILEARKDLSPRDFKQEYEASFEALSNKVIDLFDRELNVRPVADTGGELLVGIDFNVSPMSAVVGVKVGEQLHIFKEYKLANSNTRHLMECICSDFEGRNICTFPDPSGKARKTSAIGGETDFTIIRSFGALVVAPNKAPHVADSINNLNTLMCNGAGERRIFVDPNCKKLIKDLDTWVYEDAHGDSAKNSRPDKKSGADHLPDALKYLVWSEFRIEGTKASQVKIKGF
jgi:hypothetical protein